jgi:hypothetical protein
MSIAPLSMSCKGCCPGSASGVAYTLADTMKKVKDLVHIYLMRAVFFMRIACHIAWSATKTAVANAAGKTAELARRVANAIIGLARSFATQALDLMVKVMRIAAAFFAKAAELFAGAWSSMKEGAAQGLKVARSFLAAHQKEALIAGAAVVVGTAAIYAVSHFAHRARTTVAV